MTKLEKKTTEKENKYSIELYDSDMKLWAFIDSSNDLKEAKTIMNKLFEEDKGMYTYRVMQKLKTGVKTLDEIKNE